MSSTPLLPGSGAPPPSAALLSATAACLVLVGNTGQGLPAVLDRWVAGADGAGAMMASYLPLHLACLAAAAARHARCSGRYDAIIAPAPSAPATQRSRTAGRPCPVLPTRTRHAAVALSSAAEGGGAPLPGRSGVELMPAAKIAAGRRQGGSVASHPTVCGSRPSSSGFDFRIRGDAAALAAPQPAMPPRRAQR